MCKLLSTSSVCFWLVSGIWQSRAMTRGSRNAFQLVLLIGGTTYQGIASGDGAPPQASCMPWAYTL